MMLMMPYPFWLLFDVHIQHPVLGSGMMYLCVSVIMWLSLVRIAQAAFGIGLEVQAGVGPEQAGNIPGLVPCAHLG